MPRAGVSTRSDSMARPAVAVGLSAVIFAADLATPLGIAGGVPYVVVVLVAVGMPGTRPVWVAAGSSSGLTLLGLVLSPSGAAIGLTLANRALALFAIWTTAVLSVGRKQADQRFELAVRGSPHAVLMVDRDGRITLTNPQAENVFGYSEEELAGESVERLIPSRFRGDHPRLRSDFHRRPEIRAMGEGRDLWARRKDGSELPVEIGLTPVSMERQSYVLVTLVDITERKLAEEAMVGRNRELQTLVQVISHDLKEPLRAIQSFSSIVRDRYHDELDSKGRDYLRRVVDASARLRRLLDEVLQLARARRGGERSEVQGAVLVEESLRRLQAAIDESGARVAVAPSLPVLRVDETLATEAVYNLIANALKFTRDGCAPEVEIDAYRPGGEDDVVAGIVVRDRGPGVPEELRERMFGLFQRGVGREVDGTGAGLAIVRAIAEQHGGSAWMQERAGGGAEFFVTFGRSSRG